MPVFTHGQLYIALLRVTDIVGLSLLLPQNGDAATTYYISGGVATLLAYSSGNSGGNRAVAGQ